MTPIFLILAFALSPDPSVAALGAPKFADREKAQRALQGRMTWALAVRLEWVIAARREGASDVSPEAARRVQRLVEAWWTAAYPAPEKCPYIDSLNTVKLCWPPDCALVRHYLARVGDGHERSPSYLAYRHATWLMLQDLRRLHVPPALVRPLLTYMRARSEAWDRERRR